MDKERKRASLFLDQWWWWSRYIFFSSSGPKDTTTQNVKKKKFFFTEKNRVIILIKHTHTQHANYNYGGKKKSHDGKTGTEEIFFSFYLDHIVGDLLNDLLWMIIINMEITNWLWIKLLLLSSWMTFIDYKLKTFFFFFFVVEKKFEKLLFTHQVSEWTIESIDCYYCFIQWKIKEKKKLENLSIDNFFFWIWMMIIIIHIQLFMIVEYCRIWIFLFFVQPTGIK